MSSVAHFDTLRYVETLTTAGVPEPVAKASATALGTAFQQWGSGFLATKGDIFELKSEIAAIHAELKSDIAALRTELKSDIAALRAELKGEIAAIHTELKNDITALRVDQADIRSELKLVKWMSATSVACVLMLLVRSFL